MMFGHGELGLQPTHVRDTGAGYEMFRQHFCLNTFVFQQEKQHMRFIFLTCRHHGWVYYLVNQIGGRRDLKCMNQLIEALGISARKHVWFLNHP